MQQLSKGAPMALAAVRAGTSQPTAPKWREGVGLPSERRKPRRHRTREDSFEAP